MPETYTEITTNQLSELLEDQRERILDIRPLAAYNGWRLNGETRGGHIPGAKHIDMMDRTFMKQIEQLDKDKTYYVYCRSGSRSAAVCREMGNSGFKNLYNLAGGMIGWRGKISY